MVGDDDELTEGLLDVLDSILDMIETDISYIAPLFGATSPNITNSPFINQRRTKINTLRKKFKENLSKQVKTI